MLTKKEQNAIQALKDVFSDWPQTLELFAFSGSLKVVKDDPRCKKVVAEIFGVYADGGDLGEDEDGYLTL